MWFRDSKGKMICVMRDNFHTDTEYYTHLQNIIRKKNLTVL